jgi:hypothetical protein
LFDPEVLIVESLTFGKMWVLAERSNTVDTRAEFTTELLMGIFWEESQFRNIGQIDFESGGRMRAYGFGQVQVETMQVINALYKDKRHHYTAETVLGSDQVSVDMSVDYLRRLRTAFRASSKRSILCMYGEGRGESKASANAINTVNAWMNCENQLLAAKGNFTKEVILRALGAANPPGKQRGPVPEEIADGGYSSVWGF